MLQLHKGYPDCVRGGCEVIRGLAEERGVHGEEGQGRARAGDRQRTYSLPINYSSLR